MRVRRRWHPGEAASPPIAALIVSRQARARVQGSLRSSSALTFYESAGELAGAVRARPVQAVILEPRDRDGVLTAPIARSIREGFPSVPVLAYCEVMRPAASSDILALARAGVNELVFKDVDDLGVALRSALASAERRCLAARALSELAPHVPATMRPVLQYCLEHAHDALTVADLARAHGIHRKTLHNRLCEAVLPGPRALLGWCRLLVAAELLEDPKRPIEQVALSLDYPSAAAFRNMLRRYTGLAPSEVRVNGGAACILHAFRMALSRGRAGARRIAPAAEPRPGGT